MISESDSSEDMNSIEPGDRLYIVRVFDPFHGGVVSSGAKIPVDEIVRIDTESMNHDVAFSDGVRIAAANTVLRRMYGDGPLPDGVHVVGVQEVSQREMHDIITLTEEARKGQETS